MEGLIPEDESVRLLSHELEELDYTLLYQAYSAKGRNPAVDPKTMFKILTYAYSQNIYSSRKIETACRRDINFMWLLAGQKAPDHSTIARFRTGFLADACEDLFYQMVRRLAAMDELSKEMEAALQLLNLEYMQSFSILRENRVSDLRRIVDYLTDYCRGYLSGQKRCMDKREVLNGISANEKIWDMMPNVIPISVTPEKSYRPYT